MNDKADVRPVHVGGPKQRLRFLEEGKVEAAAVMEPWITVAAKRGLKIVAEAFYEGAEVATPDVDPQMYAAITRAINKAVAEINRDIRPYLKYMIREVPQELATLTGRRFLPAAVSLRAAAAVYARGVRVPARLDDELGAARSGERVRQDRRCAGLRVRSRPRDCRVHREPRNDMDHDE